MPDITPDEFEDIDDYAAAVQAAAIADAARPDFEFAIGGTDPDGWDRAAEYAIEPDRGACARAITDELAGAIESLPDFRPEARIVTRTVAYGPWRYVTPQEIRDGAFADCLVRIINHWKENHCP